MPAFDAHIRAFQDDRTERASLDRINRAKEHWRAYLQGSAELELLLNKQTTLLSAWQAEDRALRSSRARPVVCSDCGARHLAHFYTSRVGGSTLCQWCFQSRVTRFGELTGDPDAVSCAYRCDAGIGTLFFCGGGEITLSVKAICRSVSSGGFAF